jgi:hypothetical protein
MNRVCSRCKELKASSSFGKLSKSKDGLDYWCKSCKSKQSKLTMNYKEHNEKTKAIRNGWHIDHIKPCSSFDLTKEEEQRKCFHYTNLQPLWATDNRKKADKIDHKKDDKDNF